MPRNSRRSAAVAHAASGAVTLEASNPPVEPDEHDGTARSVTSPTAAETAALEAPALSAASVASRDEYKPLQVTSKNLI